MAAFRISTADIKQSGIGPEVASNASSAGVRSEEPPCD